MKEGKKETKKEEMKEKNEKERMKENKKKEIDNQQSQVTTALPHKEGQGDGPIDSGSDGSISSRSLFGLLGHPLGHSFSRAYFNNMFAREGIDAEYLNFDIPSIDMLPQIVAEHPNLRGLNVTIPYKKTVIPFLDELSDEARAIGAVNVVRISRLNDFAISPLEKEQQGTENLSHRNLANRSILTGFNSDIINRPILKGFNSDIIGFMDSIRPLLQPHHRRALVLGTGGASKAICRGLELLGLEWRYVTRQIKSPAPAITSATNPAPSITSATDPAPSITSVTCSVSGGLSAGTQPPLTYSSLSPALLADYTVIVNCTPLGMFPNVDTAPPIAYAALSPRHLLYDLVYNPEETLFMRQGRRFGATVKGGLEMLHLQALASWRFWNSNT